MLMMMVVVVVVHGGGGGGGPAVEVLMVVVFMVVGETRESCKEAELYFDTVTCASRNSSWSDEKAEEEGDRGMERDRGGGGGDVCAVVVAVLLWMEVTEVAVVTRFAVTV